MNILIELIIQNSPPGYNLAEHIVKANKRDVAKKFESYFFEALLKYSYKLNTGSDLVPIGNIQSWRLFKHATHPLLTYDNEVTYVIDFDETTQQKVRQFLLR
jgi:hypothetical protein